MGLLQSKTRIVALLRFHECRRNTHAGQAGIVDEGLLPLIAVTGPDIALNPRPFARCSSIYGGFHSPVAVVYDSAAAIGRVRRNGRSITKVVPLPTSLSTLTAPPWLDAISRTIESPRP
jgi:hypothetical protein